MSRDLLSGLWTASELPRFSAAEWELLLAQARATRLLARLALRLQSQGWQSAVPPRVWQHFDSALRVAAALRRNVQQETRHLACALLSLNTPVVLLKGAAYIAADLPAGRGRLFSDIDILVRRDRLQDVELALMAAGWIPEKLKPYDDRYYRQWMHELPPLQHVRRQTHLDVHHTLAPPTSRYVIDGSDMLARSLPISQHEEAGAQQLRMLAPTDLVLHSALHLMQEGEFNAGLRDLLDIRDLLIDFGEQAGFWPSLAARAQALGLEQVLAQVLAQLHRLFAFSPPKSPSAPTSKPRSGSLLKFLLPRVLAPPDPARETLTTLAARQLMYVRSHWLRMPWYQIVPHVLRKVWARIADRRAAANT